LSRRVGEREGEERGGRRTCVDDVLVGRHVAQLARSVLLHLLPAAPRPPHSAPLGLHPPPPCFRVCVSPHCEAGSESPRRGDTPVGMGAWGGSPLTAKSSAHQWAGGGKTLTPSAQRLEVTTVQCGAAYELDTCGCGPRDVGGSTQPLTTSKPLGSLPRSRFCTHGAAGQAGEQGRKVRRTHPWRGVVDGIAVVVWIGGRLPLLRSQRRIIVDLHRLAHDVPLSPTRAPVWWWCPPTTAPCPTVYGGERGCVCGRRVLCDGGMLCYLDA
jgi:hypothetical protein